MLMACPRADLEERHLNETQIGKLPRSKTCSEFWRTSRCKVMWRALWQKKHQVWKYEIWWSASGEMHRYAKMSWNVRLEDKGRTTTGMVWIEKWHHQIWLWKITLAAWWNPERSKLVSEDQVGGYFQLTKDDSLT